MPLDAQVKKFLDEMAKLPRLYTLPVDIARSMTIPLGPAVDVAHVEDLLVPSPEGHDIPN